MDVRDDEEHLLLWDDEVEQWVEEQPKLWWRVLQYVLVCLVGGVGLGMVMTMTAMIALVFFGFGALMGGLAAL